MPLEHSHTTEVLLGYLLEDRLGRALARQRTREARRARRASARPPSERSRLRPARRGERPKRAGGASTGKSASTRRAGA